MILTKVIIFKPSINKKIILDSFAYASTKLWNIANYEKHNYKDLNFETFPNWYDQKKRLKDNFWFKNLPSQTSQNVLDVLQKSWKSFFELKKTKGIKNPSPPKYKKKNSLLNFTFLNNGFNVINDDTINFTISKQLKDYLKEKYSINYKYLTLKIDNFSKVDGNIKTIEFKPFKNNTYKVFIVYEMKNPTIKEDNQRYLSIDIGIKNLFTCYDNKGHSFIISGSKYLNINYYYNKKIAYYQSIAYQQQIANGSKYWKDTKRIKRLYDKKNKQLNHFLHTVTKSIKDYCVAHDIAKVIIGDIKNIRKDTNLGHKTNQKLHSLPYAKTYALLEYKLLKEGIELIKQKESYSSQCSPTTPTVSKEFATKKNRIKRGLFISDRVKYNADSVGAYNILRLYEQQTKKVIPKLLKGLSSPQRINVSV